MKKVGKSSEDYLEAIYVLRREIGLVRSVDVANHLDVTRPSVSKAVKKLEEQNHIVMEENGELVLTESGLKIAKDVDDRHQTLYRLLRKLGVSDQVADEDACKIEHALSDETFSKLKDFLAEG